MPTIEYFITLQQKDSYVSILDYYVKILIFYRLWLNVGMILISINICIAGFLIVYLSYVKKVHSDEWERRYPALIPLATAAFVLGGIL